MEEFDIYKDLNLFLRMVYYRSLYSDKSSEPTTSGEPNPGDTLALQQLESLFEEGEVSSDEEDIPPLRTSGGERQGYAYDLPKCPNLGKTGDWGPSWT